jgi:hypothetical protein
MTQRKCTKKKAPETRCLRGHKSRVFENFIVIKESVLLMTWKPPLNIRTEMYETTFTK